MKTSTLTLLTTGLMLVAASIGALIDHATQASADNLKIIVPPAITGGIAALACAYTAFTTYRFKQIEYAMSFQKRFDELVVYRRSIKEKIEADRSKSGDFQELVDDYYYRFWNLQLEQWQTHRLRLLPDDLFNLWMKLRHTDFDQNKKLGNTSFREGWDKMKGILAEPEFIEFMKTKMWKRGS